MSSIAVAKSLSNSYEFAGRKWSYDFRKLPHVFDEEVCEKNANSLSQQYCEITKCWSTNTNSEWICRIYFAAKMVLNSTLQLMSLEFADEKNLRNVIPYLKYYAALSACRCVAITLPTIFWNNGKIFEMTHSKIINSTFDYLAKFNKNISEKLKNEVTFLKAARELIAYRAPSSGDHWLDNAFDIKDFCTLLVELGQFNSEILENSIRKNADKNNFEFK